MNGFPIENSRPEVNPPFWSSFNVALGKTSQGHTAKRLKDKSLFMEVSVSLLKAAEGQKKTFSKHNLFVNPQGNSVKKIEAAQFLKKAISRN